MSARDRTGHLPYALYTQGFAKRRQPHRREVVDYAVQMWRESKGEQRRCPTISSTPRHWPPLDHVKMQAARQKWVDRQYLENQSNCPEDISLTRSRMSIWRRGYQGCKGPARPNRPNDVTGSVLSALKAPDTAPGRKLQAQPRGRGRMKVAICRPAGPPRRAGRVHLQDQMARQRARAVYHHK